MKKILFISLLLLSATSYGQQTENLIDSLNASIEKAGNDSLKSFLYVELAWAYAENNPSKSLKISRLAKKHAILSEDTANLIDAENAIGVFNSFLGKPDSTVIHFQNALQYAEEIGDQQSIANGSTNLGIIYQQKGLFEKALEMFVKAGKIHEKLDNSRGKHMIYNGIGTVYKEMGVFDKALKNFNKYLELSIEMGDKKSESFALHNIGSVYDLQKKFNKAIEYYEKSRKLKEELGMNANLATTYTNLGITYKSMGNIEEAEKYLDRALEINKSLGDEYSLVFDYIGLGDIYGRQGKYSKSIDYLEKSIAICKKNGYGIDLADSYQMLAQTYHLKGNSNAAYKYHKMYAELKDSLLNSENNKRISELEARYQSEKKELQIKNLSMNNDLKEVELVKKEALIDKKNIQNISLAGGFGIMLILAFIIYRSYKRKKKSNEIISLQKEKVETQKTMLEEKNIEILDSINYAKRIQEAILPPTRIVKNWLPDSFILYLPKDIVAGDFYWMDEKDDKVLFAACDCTGHGVPGAMVSVVSHNALNRAVREFGLTDPGKILDKVNELVEETFEQSEKEIRDGMDLGLCTYQPDTGKLQYAGANNPLWLVRGDELIEYKADKQPIGYIETKKSFTTHDVETRRGDKVYLFSDGYHDQFGGEKGKKLKKSHFKKLLLRINDMDMERQRSELHDFFLDWKKDQDQIDDVCIVGVNVHK